MFHQFATRSVLCGVIAAFGTLATFDAAQAQLRARFTPPYGAPFDEATNGLGNALEWSGEAIVSYSSCTDVGLVSNLSGNCAGLFTFTSAVLYLSNASNPTNYLQTINFTAADFGQVTYVDRATVPTAQAIYSTPFKPVQGNISETMYGTDQAYFSLVFAGAYAQLYWFKSDPYAGNVDVAALYSNCALAGAGDNGVLGNRCGLSSGVDPKGAKLEITPVPEPGTYALMLAGLGIVGLIGRRRRAA